jgi:hypothetical protein
MESIKLYKTGSIYKLSGLDKDNNEVVYIGGTVNLLCNRKSIHKYHWKKYKEGTFKNYCSSYEVFNNCNEVKIELLDKIENCSRQQLREKEDIYINQYNCINKKQAILTEERKKEQQREGAKKHYYKFHEIEKDKKRKYYWDNKEVALERAKEHYQQNKEKIKEYNLIYQKEYKKRPEVIERLKEYRERYRDKAREYARERYNKIKNNNISIDNGTKGN